MTARAMFSIWPLFFGLSLIGLAIGVQGSLLGVRAEMEGFADLQIGLLMSGYFAGFLAGSMFAPRLIEQVGHIRVFAAVAAMASVTILVHALFIEPWTWAAMRLLTGFAFSCIYVVAESWLNKAATNETRGQILAVYMSIMMAGICAGQFMLGLSDPGSFVLFAIISVMVSIAAVPILMTVLTAPLIEDTERVSVAHLWRRAPMGVMGLVLSQWCASVVFSMGAVYATKLGLTVLEVSYFMGVMMGGGMVFQMPLGRLSDSIDRRWVIGGASLVAVITALLISRETAASLWMYGLLFIFGGCSMSLYSLVVAITNDHLRPNEIVPASGTMVLISGLVSITGPISISLWMEAYGIGAFFPILASCLLLLAIISIYRVLTIPALPAEYKTHSTIQAAATTVGTVLHYDENELKENLETD